MGMIDKLLGRSEAGAGRGKVNPATIAEMEDAKRSPAEREARQMMRDRAEAKMAESEYNKAMPTPYAKGGKVGAASKRADGIAERGKTRGKMC
jgi:hypothetical protein